MSETPRESRLRPMEPDDMDVLTDRQAEDHAQNVRGEQEPDPEEGGELTPDS